jgi:hypothetical protein
MQARFSANRISKVSAASYKVVPAGIKFDSLASFNAEMEPTFLGGADFTRYSESFHAMAMSMEVARNLS